MLLHTSFSRCFIGLITFSILFFGSSYSAVALEDPPSCDYSPVTAQMLSETSQADWAAWIAQLSGAKTIYLDGVPSTITTRYSYALFNGQSNARAYDFVLSQVQGWYPSSQIEEHEFRFDGQTWKNLIVTIPGSQQPDEVVLLTAHLDSTTPEAHRLAPGAEDNASGSAALLEAARLWRSFRFQRTLRLIWFTGEEQGLIGSRAYVQDHDVSNLQAVINLDMFGYDSDNDRCFELHAGTLPASKPLVSCFENTIQAYNLKLRMDRITALDMRFSDHAVFWDQGIGSVLVLENHMSNSPENGCEGRVDASPNYHTANDTMSSMNLASGFAIAQASLASAAGLAGPVEACFAQSPLLEVDQVPGAPEFKWQSLPGVEAVRLLKSRHGCGGPWEVLTITDGNSFTDHRVLSGWKYAYRIEAWSEANGRVCVSLPGNCQTIIASSAVNSHPMHKE